MRRKRDEAGTNNTGDVATQRAPAAGETAAECWSASNLDEHSITCSHTASQNGRPSHVPGLDIMSVYQEIRWSVTGRHYVVSTSSLSAARSWLDTLSIVSFSWAIFSARFCLRVTSHPVSRSVSQSVSRSVGQRVLTGDVIAAASGRRSSKRQPEVIDRADPWRITTIRTS